MQRTTLRAGTFLAVAALALTTTFAIAAKDDPGPGGIIVPPAPAGDIVFASDRFDGDYEIFTMTLTGSGQTRRTNSAGDNTLPVWSPDGTKIAFVSNRTGNNEIFVMNGNGTGQTNLTNNMANDTYPSWSPDGTKITFSTNRDGDSEVYVMNADGSGQTNRSNNGIEDWAPAWSPNGQQIAFVRDDAVYVMNANGGNQQELEQAPSSILSRLAWEPDGSRIAFSRYANANVWAIDADGSNLTSLFAGASPAWSPDGDRMVFQRDSEIRIANEDGGDQIQLTNNDDSDIQPDWKGTGGGGALIGDVNCNGVVDAIDASLVLQLDAGLINALQCPQNGDVNENGQTNSLDAAIILQYAAGLVQQLPP